MAENGISNSMVARRYGDNCAPQKAESSRSRSKRRRRRARKVALQKASGSQAAQAERIDAMENAEAKLRTELEGRSKMEVSLRKEMGELRDRLHEKEAEAVALRSLWGNRTDGLGVRRGRVPMRAVAPIVAPVANQHQLQLRSTITVTIIPHAVMEGVALDSGLGFDQRSVRAHFI